MFVTQTVGQGNTKHTTAIRVAALAFSFLKGSFLYKLMCSRWRNNAFTSLQNTDRKQLIYRSLLSQQTATSTAEHLIK